MNAQQAQIRNGLDMIVAATHKAQGRHLDHFLAAKSAADMVEAKVFPNSKEITESMGAFTACYKSAGLLLGDPSVSAFVVGDGCTPRTGALLAYRSAWTVTSIDPVLKGTWNQIRRLTVIPKRIEDIDPVEVDTALIVLVHAHVTVASCLDKIRARARRVVVAMPCCVPHDLPGLEPDLVYDDAAVWSPKRTIKIWRNVLPSEA